MKRNHWLPAIVCIVIGLCSSPLFARGGGGGGGGGHSGGGGGGGHVGGGGGGTLAGRRRRRSPGGGAGGATFQVGGDSFRRGRCSTFRWRRCFVESIGNVQSHVSGQSTFGHSPITSSPSMAHSSISASPQVGLHPGFTSSLQPSFSPNHSSAITANHSSGITAALTLELFSKVLPELLTTSATRSRAGCTTAGRLTCPEMRIIISGFNNAGINPASTIPESTTSTGSLSSALRR